MKILQLGKFFPPENGGIESVTRDLHNLFNGHNMRADVLCFTKNRKSSVEISNNGSIFRSKITFVFKSVPFSFIYFIKFIKINKNYDIIHIHLPNPLIEALVLFYPIKAKLFLHWHGDVDVNRFGFVSRFYISLTSKLVNKSNRVIAPSYSHVNTSYLKTILEKKTTVIPFLFDSMFIKEVTLFTDSDADIIFENKFVILSVGRLIYYKGFQFLVEAASFLPEDFLILIVGDGPLKNDLIEMVVNYNLSGRVKILGSLSNMELRKLYERCDIFCLPSIYRGEMYGIVQLEAMSFGKPVLNTFIEGSAVHEVSIHGLTGLTVASGDAKALAESILVLKNDLKMRTEFGLAAKCRILEHHNPQIILEHFRSVYNLY